MKVNYDIRMDMLGIIRDEITDSGAPKEIEFLDSADVILCILPFDNFIPISGSSGKAIFKFKSIDGTYVLKNGVTTAGNVSKFRVYGPTSNIVLEGTVGGLTTVSDLKFSRTDWSAETFIIVQDLMVTIPQGS